MAWLRCESAAKTFYDREVMGDAGPLVFENGKARTTKEIAQSLADKYEAFSVTSSSSKGKETSADEDNGGDEEEEADE